MSRVPIHDHTNIHQGGKLPPGSSSTPPLSPGAGSGVPGGGGISLPIGATDVSIADAGGYFSATDVEAALQDLAAGDRGYLAHGNMGSTETFDASAAGWHSGTFDADCTFTFTGATSGLVASMVHELESDGTHVGTWPGSVIWPGGVAPTLSTTPGDIDILTFFSRDGGTTWYGFVAGGSSSGVTYGIPAIVLGTAAADGSTDEAIRRDATIVAFDAMVPVTQAFGDSAATGSAAVAARRDHKHGMPATPATGGGSGDHEHMIDVFNGDASTTAFELTDEPLDPQAVFAFVGGSWTAVTISGAMNTTATFGSAPGSGTGNVVIQYPAVSV